MREARSSSTFACSSAVSCAFSAVSAVRISSARPIRERSRPTRKAKGRQAKTAIEATKANSLDLVWEPGLAGDQLDQEEEECDAAGGEHRS